MEHHGTSEPATLEARVVELEQHSCRLALVLLDLVDVVQTLVHDLTPFDDGAPPLVALQVAS